MNKLLIFLICIVALGAIFADPVIFMLLLFIAILIVVLVHPAFDGIADKFNRLVDQKHEEKRRRDR